MFGGFLIIGIIILIVAMIAGGIYSIIEYTKTKEKIYLIIGLVLTFIVIGVFIYIFMNIPSTTVTYAPPDGF
jgi:uncharacterized membrane protein